MAIKKDNNWYVFRRGLQHMDLNIAFYMRQTVKQTKNKKNIGLLNEGAWFVCISLYWSIDNTVTNTSNKPSSLTLSVH